MSGAVSLAAQETASKTPVVIPGMAEVTTMRKMVWKRPPPKAAEARRW